jgi:Protein of unknown function (DUF3164)
MQTVKFQTDKIWVNASGDAVPFKFVPPIDRKKETMAQKVYKQALQAEKILQDLYYFMADTFSAINALVKKEYEIKGKEKKAGKGSFTWFNFDKSLKIEADIHEVVKWDEALSSEAYQLFKEYISQALSGDRELIDGLVTETFANNKGMIDTKKAFQIIKWGRKIKHSKFQKACDLLIQAQGIDRTKLYMRVWVKEEDGSYRNIVLNFSQI